jgi:hypothetical protein
MIHGDQVTELHQRCHIVVTEKHHTNLNSQRLDGWKQQATTQSKGNPMNNLITVADAEIALPRHVLVQLQCLVRCVTTCINKMLRIIETDLTDEVHKFSYTNIQHCIVQPYAYWRRNKSCLRLHKKEPKPQALSGCKKSLPAGLLLMSR